MVSTNARGQYGPPCLRASASHDPSGRSLAPWIGVGLAAVGLALVGTHAALRRPRLTAHEKEVRAWKAEFPGLPWYMDEVRDARQLDLWERARDHWERTR